MRRITADEINAAVVDLQAVHQEGEHTAVKDWIQRRLDFPYANLAHGRVGWPDIVGHLVDQGERVAGDDLATITTSSVIRGMMLALRVVETQDHEAAMLEVDAGVRDERHVPDLPTALEENLEDPAAWPAHLCQGAYQPAGAPAPYRCTLNAHHQGPHEAHGSDPLVTWTDPT